MAKATSKAKNTVAHETRNDIPEELRAEMITLLNKQLASALDLRMQAKQAHWNVKGPHFIGLHELFDQVAEAVIVYVDDIAERAVQLGGVAEGTLQTVSGKTALDEYPLDISDGKDHVAALSNALAKFGKDVREGIDKSDDAGDKDTADLLTEISRGVDKYLWFVEAHIQS